jgi:hypothetical protein
MAKIMSRMMKRDERGMALMLALFALLLLSGIGLCMVLSSNTETRIDANYGGSLRSYYAAHSGLEEVRDRISYPKSNTSPTGLANFLPTDIAGNPNGVLYVLNPQAGETVDPTDSSSPYFDVQLCHDYNSGVTIRDSRCTAVPTMTNWMAWQNAAPGATPTALPLGYKWVRINLKTNRVAAPYYVDQKGDAATLDTRVCWDGETEQLSPGGATPACDANGMQPVYMLTSLAVSQGTRNLLRAEVVGTSIRPPGAITMEVGSSTNTTPIPATFNVNTSSNATLIPLTSIDGRVHKADGSLSTASSCSQVAALASNSPQGTASLQTGLNNLRSAIVQAANGSCDSGGNTIPFNTFGQCTAPLAWVRGTGALPKFTTIPVSTSQPPALSPIPTPAPTPVSVSSSNSGTGGGGHDGHDDHNPTPTPTPIPTPTPTPTPVPTGDCSTATQSCFTNLDLSDSHLTAAAPLFAGNPGNSGDPAAYQSPTANIIANENQAVLDYIAARRASGANYYELASTSLNPAQAYGTPPDQPAVLVITDTSLKLTASLTGFGILQVPNDFEINSNLQWTGIVMVRSSLTSPSGKFLINSGANGSINGALMLQALNQFTLTTSSTGANAFAISYSCDAIDAAMGNRPLKVVSHTETSY